MFNSYYWSDDWSEDFYIELAKAGFISTSQESPVGLLLLPELQFDYALLDFDELHISKKVRKLLQKNDYEFCINSNFNETLKKIAMQHKYNWLKDEYVDLLQKLYANNHLREDFKILCITVVSKESKELISGEVGYVIEKTYTSLSGFSLKEKKYSNYGTLQLVLLAQYLEKNGFDFWNLGHSHMKYKERLGCKIHTREDFLKRFRCAILKD